MLPLVVILVAILVVAIAGYWYLTQGRSSELLSPTSSTVAEFNGTGDATTDEFQVRGGWQIQWETSGDRFSFAIIGDEDFGTVMERDEPGSGTTARAHSGTYRLDIAAEGQWSVRIVQGQ